MHTSWLGLVNSDAFSKIEITEIMRQTFVMILQRCSSRGLNTLTCAYLVNKVKHGQALAKAISIQYIPQDETVSLHGKMQG